MAESVVEGHLDSVEYVKSENARDEAFKEALALMRNLIKWNSNRRGHDPNDPVKCAQAGCVICAIRHFVAEFAEIQ